MACPTCDHTMQSVAKSAAAVSYWCQRCGTLKVQSGNLVDNQMPKLIERCREFQMQLKVSKGLGSRFDQLGTWQRLGIAEAIDLPEKRV